MKTFLAALLLVGAVAHAAPQSRQPDESLLKEVATAQARGFRWLLTKQMEDGSWNKHPAITGLALTALCRSHPELTIEQKAAAEKAEKFILSCVKPTGAIFGGNDTDKYPNYSTAICVMALVATGKPAHLPVIKNARQFLLGSQFDEGEEATPANASYGGIGYGRRERPDLSNMSWALEAIKLTDSLDSLAEGSPHAGGKLHWQKALKFLERCQHLSSHNDQLWAKESEDRDVGGFVYMPGDAEKGVPPMSFADEGLAAEPGQRLPLRSTGSMGYAGLKSFIYADLKPDDPRVVAVMQWLARNYSLAENPGLGKQGLYYYYQMMAKALTAYGADTFRTADGRELDWRTEMLRNFVALQKIEGDQGYWQNENNRWWEGDPVLVTSYSLLALDVLTKRQYP